MSYYRKYVTFYSKEVEEKIKQEGKNAHRYINELILKDLSGNDEKIRQIVKEELSKVSPMKTTAIKTEYDISSSIKGIMGD